LQLDALERDRQRRRDERRSAAVHVGDEHLSIERLLLADDAGARIDEHDPTR
jgi:hypothetical protein